MFDKNKERITLIILFAIAVPYFWLRIGPQNDNYQSINKKNVLYKYQQGNLFNQKEFTFYDSIIELAKENRYQEAIERIDSAILTSPSDYLLFDTKGTLLLSKGDDYRGSIDCFSKAINLAGYEKPKLLAHRAAAYHKLKLHDSATVDYQKAVAYNKHYYKALANMYEEMKFVDSAIKYYQLFLTHYPDSLGALLKITQLEKTNR